jgi:hypothetical protein
VLNAVAAVSSPAPAQDLPFPASRGASVHENRRALKAQWEAEQSDQEATDQLSAYVSDALHDLQVDGELDELVCKRTLCRLNMHFANVAQALKFQDAAGMQERRRDIGIMVADGVVDVEVLLARVDE